jgi:HlyD family secretion protein
VFWGTIGVFLVGAFALAMRPRAVPVDLAAVTRGPLSVTLDHEGRTRVRERFVVSAPVAGRVLRIELRPGDRVAAKETVIATFLPAVSPLLDARTQAEAQSRVSAAEAVLQQARAQREQARVQSDHAAQERDRARGLAQFGLITTEARQAAETEASARRRALDAADAAVNAAAHDLDTSRAALIEPGAGGTGETGSRPTLTLRSPIDGVVLARLRESEAVVPQGEPLVEVGNTSALEVIADFLSTDAVNIQPGMPALIDQWGGTRPLSAVVRRVEPAGFVKVSALGVEEQRVWVVIDFKDAALAGQTLGDGYRIEARVVVWERPDVVQAPTSSLFRRGDGWAVYVADGGTARRRTVTVGHRTGTAAEVLSGLSAGDYVVAYPPDSIGDGTRIASR